MAGGKKTAAAAGAWLCFEDEAGRSLRPPKARTWGRRGHTPVMKVTGRGHGGIHVAGLIAVKPGRRPRMTYRIRRRTPGRRSLTETDHAALLDTLHRRLNAPIVLIWDNLNTHTSTRMRGLIDARPWLSVHRLPPYAPDLNPVEGMWAHMKGTLAEVSTTTPDRLTTEVDTRLRSIQHRPGLLNGFILKTGLEPQPP